MNSTGFDFAAVLQSLAIAAAAVAVVMVLVRALGGPRRPAAPRARPASCRTAYAAASSHGGRQSRSATGVRSASASRRPDEDRRRREEDERRRNDDAYNDYDAPTSWSRDEPHAAPGACHSHHSHDTPVCDDPD